MYKFIWVHFVFDHLYNNNNGEPNVGVEYQILFYIFNINRLVLTYQRLFLKLYFENEMPKEKREKIIIKFKSYTFYGGKLYKLGLNAIYKQDLTTKVKSILIKLHKGLVGGHFSVNTL